MSRVCACCQQPDSYFCLVYGLSAENPETPYRRKIYFCKTCGYQWVTTLGCFECGEPMIQVNLEQKWVCARKGVTRQYGGMSMTHAMFLECKKHDQTFKETVMLCSRQCKKTFTHNHVEKSVTHTCYYCKKMVDHIKKCSRCGIRYCSVECQRAHWSQHKSVCVVYK